jgi:hypothetical protein
MKVVIEQEILWGLCWGNCYSVMQIANMFDCSEDTVYCRMEKYGIPRRHGLTGFTFNDKQKQIFEGLMLGDGGLIWKGSNCCFENCDVHKEYLTWLQRQLGIENISYVVPKYNSFFADIVDLYRLSTKVIPSIRDEYKRWYPDGKGTNENRHYKVIPKDIELTLTKVLFWYIGDGGYIKDRETVHFCNSLVFVAWEVLAKGIFKLLDVDSGVSVAKQSKNKDGTQRYNLYLNKIATRKFFDMVDSLGFDIPDCYQYKFRWS